MKKILAVLTIISFIACTNPSMERGLESLNDALANLEASLEAAGIPQMEADIEALNIQVTGILADVETYSAEMEQFNHDLSVLLGQLDALHEQIVGITGDVTQTGLATSDQLQGILADLEEFQAGLDILVNLADYDYDGVINGLDKCPDTPITEINDVDTDGCSPSQLED
jgi:soluble cytochrome b562